MLIITFIFAIWAFKMVGWKVINNGHSYTAFPVLGLVLFVVLFGVASRSLLNRSVWNTAFALKVKCGHKIIAWLVLLSGFCAIPYGIYFYRINPKHASDVPLEWY